jgi:hypothetical protein
MSTDSDRREHERKQFFAEATLEFSSGKYQARISDISLGGCYIDSIASVVEGEAIALTLAVGDGEPQRFAGMVAYVLPGFGFGVRFTDLNEEKTAFLQQLLG